MTNWISSLGKGKVRRDTWQDLVHVVYCFLVGCTAGYQPEAVQLCGLQLSQRCGLLIELECILAIEIRIRNNHLMEMVFLFPVRFSFLCDLDLPM